MRSLRYQWSIRKLPQQRGLSQATRNTSTGVVTPVAPLTSILIANRGEIALRVGRTAAESGIRVTTVYTDPDSQSQHAQSSPYSINLGKSTEYLNGNRIIEIAKKGGCQGIHPGYGFLSENADFARRCTEEGLVFIGPPYSAIEAMGNKSRSKDIMTAAGVPCIPGYHGAVQDPKYLEKEAEKIGYPVLLKAVKGGGGKGMRICQRPEEFQDQLVSAKSEARNSFGDDVMLVEKYITTPRHIEVQIFADRHGNCVALGERDCSIQRRHQKILEESPAPHLAEAVRQDLWGKARAAALAVKYEGAGTVEFIFDNDTGQFFFMEMNTRLQVEHPVTEMITGLDLVHWQFLVAEGRELPLDQDAITARIAERGWAIEARIYAENPEKNFMPDSGTLLRHRIPAVSENVRIDSGFAEGDVVSPHYDPMISKLIVRSSCRSEAIQVLRAALEKYEVVGPATNIEFLKSICAEPAFVAGDIETGFIEKHRDTLFDSPVLDNEFYAQAALGILLQDMHHQSAGMSGLPCMQIGFVDHLWAREMKISRITSTSDESLAPVVVKVRQIENHLFEISVDSTSFPTVQAALDPSSGDLTSYYPHTRLDSHVVRDGDKVDIFQQGKHIQLKLDLPAWFEKALGTKDVANSVLTPMPCKVLRVEVKTGDAVKKDQALVVIESMKMETVIRSPHDGVVSKIVHTAGDLCKAGTALVEFEDPKAVE